MRFLFEWIRNVYEKKFCPYLRKMGMEKNSKFDSAFKRLLIFEGGYVLDELDSGGETKYGISKRSYPHLNIKALTKKQAKEIYRTDWWEKYKYDKMANMCEGNYSEIAIRLFILAVNIGPKSAHKVLQRALLACGEELDVDGIIGEQTKRLLLSNGHKIIFPFRSEAAGFYRSLVAGRPELKPFLKGWLDRAYS